MDELRFDERVAVVTGAGRGIGRAYARLLAERGAHVVVNDLGGSIEGEGTDSGPAFAVVDEIDAAGGSAVGDTSDVSSEEGAQSLIATALDGFGRIDALINNAGIMQWVGFPDVDTDGLQAHLAVHVLGSFNTTRAAWPHMVEAGYGRVVMTVSTGMLGLPDNVSYATAKGGVLGLMRSLAFAGREHGIAVNAVAPAASTRMAGEGGPEMPAELVAPMTAYLSHEDCPARGEIYTAGAGRFARLFIGSTPGWVSDGAAPSMEDVAEEWETINDETGYDVPRHLVAWSRSFLAHLDPDS
ncbi:MAG: SDR family NAD(P)-dependent oxidoreductase [Acidimicrobiales bacterium]|nr:SDR family NAD(P)-dependent oxidoreductase [Acidimicrobiales bacterium]